MRFINVFLFVLKGIILPVSLSAQTISGKLIDEQPAVALRQCDAALAARFNVCKWNHQQ